MELKKVIKVEMQLNVYERVTKTKRHDYKRGGYSLEETIVRSTVSRPAALLECGHWRKDVGQGVNISTAKKLACYAC